MNAHKNCTIFNELMKVLLTIYIFHILPFTHYRPQCTIQTVYYVLVDTEQMALIKLYCH